MAVEVVLDGDPLAPRLVGLARRVRAHGVAVEDVFTLGKVYVAWCSARGCIAFAHDGNDKGLLAAKTGDAEDAVRDLEHALDELDTLWEQARNGGGPAVYRYARKKHELKRNIHRYIEMMAELDEDWRLHAGAALSGTSDDCLRKIIGRYCPCGEG